MHLHQQQHLIVRISALLNRDNSYKAVASYLHQRTALDRLYAGQYDRQQLMVL